MTTKRIIVMTDKEKIREEVARLMYGFNLEADIASGEDTETEKICFQKYGILKDMWNNLYSNGFIRIRIISF